jgi:hypothetical protein
MAIAVTSIEALLHQDGQSSGDKVKMTQEDLERRLERAEVPFSALLSEVLVVLQQCGCLYCTAHACALVATVHVLGAGHSYLINHVSL